MIPRDGAFRPMAQGVTSIRYAAFGSVGGVASRASPISQRSPTCLLLTLSGHLDLLRFGQANEAQLPVHGLRREECGTATSRPPSSATTSTKRKDDWKLRLDQWKPEKTAARRLKIQIVAPTALIATSSLPRPCSSPSKSSVALGFVALAPLPRMSRREELTRNGVSACTVARQGHLFWAQSVATKSQNGSPAEPKHN
jgi:hypothetical protein